MRVALDTRPLQNQSASRGIGVYTSHLLKYLQKIPDLEIIELKSGKSADIDLIHYPWFDFYYRTLPIRKSHPIVTTIHDVTPLVLKEFYPVGLRGKINFKLQKFALKNVSAVLTDSDVSRTDISRYLPVPAEKVHTVHLAAQEGLISEPSIELKKQVINKFKLFNPYILYVGDVNMNKNLISLVKACIQAQIELLIVGKQALSPNFDHSHPENRDLALLQDKYAREPLIRRLGFVQTQDLSVLYGLATAYCQPSLYEGFGLQLLEAMQCQCPVIAAKRGSLPEIGGKAAIYVEPQTDKIAKAIEFVLDLSPTQRKRLIQEGQKQAQKFSWEKTARETFEVYVKVLRTFDN